MLVAARRIAKGDLLPLYYTRNQVEDIFKLCKDQCKILPINIEKEETLRGHLLITFMATIVIKKILGSRRTDNGNDEADAANPKNGLRGFTGPRSSIPKGFLDADRRGHKARLQAGELLPGDASTIINKRSRLDEAMVS